MGEYGAKDARWISMAGMTPVILTGALFVYFCGMVPTIASGGIIRHSIPWIPSLDIALSFYIDGLSLMFSLLITGIGALVMLYSARYLAGHPQFARFALYLFSFMLSMLGLVLADNVLALFVFWELTTFTSYLLIGFSHADPKSRRNALQALLLTAAGGLALLAGFILLGFATGTYELSEINAAGSLASNPLYGPILVLVLLGAFTKSAQVPFHFWLPNAMAAPTPVSAYLHSATMVKGGIYLLARMHPSLSGTDAWIWTLTIFGGVTAVFASLMALRQTDLKQTLAYTTLMALGTLTMFLAGSSGYAITGAMAFLFVHSLYKAALFLSVGIIDHATGTREAGVLGGLAGAMPVTAAAAGLAALSMAGIPPFLGFIAKEVAYSGAVGASLWGFVVLAALAANALMFAVAGIVAFKPFFGPQGKLPHAPHEGPWPMLAGPVILGVLGLAFGILHGLAASWVIEPATNAVLGFTDSGGRVKLWAGFNLALGLSVVTFILGAILYLRHQALRDRLAAIEARGPDFDAGWDRLMAWLVVVAEWQTRLIQTGVLRQYLFATFAVTAVALALPLFWLGALQLDLAMPSVTLREGVVAALIIAGALLAATTGSRITGIAALGVVGIGVALIFIIYGAPDVAITQLLVEMLIVVLIAIAALRMPYLDPTDKGPAFRPRDAALGGVLGVLVALVMLMVTAGPIDRRLTDFFEAASWTEAFGRNIVNVILVDFRTLDTFGEIAVVIVAALGAFALLRSARRDKGEERE